MNLPNIRTKPLTKEQIETHKKETAYNAKYMVQEGCIVRLYKGSDTERRDLEAAYREYTFREIHKLYRKKQ